MCARGSRKKLNRKQKKKTILYDTVFAARETCPAEQYARGFNDRARAFSSITFNARAENGYHHYHYYYYLSPFGKRVVLSFRAGRQRDLRKKILRAIHCFSQKRNQRTIVFDDYR